MKHWLMKSEPSAFSLQDLKDSPGQTTSWDGIRNYQARNTMRDDMKVGDAVLFYHSSTNPTGIVGTARVVREAYPDHTAWDPDSKYFDPKASPGATVWCMVDIKFEQAFPRILTLEELKGVSGLKDMTLLRKGMRLSIQPVRASEYEAVLALAKKG